MEMVIFLLVGAAAVAAMIWGWHAAQKRRQDLAAWAHQRGLSFNPGNDYGLDNRFGQFSCLQQGDNRYAYNLCEGDWGGRPTATSDYHYQTYTHTRRGRQTHHHYFSAVILRSDLPLKPLFIRPENLFDKVTEFLGWDDIDFESAEFSRNFYVKSPDRKWAYDVIHPRTMEFLLAQPRFTIQFEGVYAIACRGTMIPVPQVQAAIDTLAGMFDRLPDYLKKQLQGGA